MSVVSFGVLSDIKNTSTSGMLASGTELAVWDGAAAGLCGGLRGAADGGGVHVPLVRALGRAPRGAASPNAAQHLGRHHHLDGRPGAHTPKNQHPLLEILMMFSLLLAVGSFTAVC